MMRSVKSTPKLSRDTGHTDRHTFGKLEYRYVRVGCEVRLCDPRVSWLPPVSFYRYDKGVKPQTACPCARSQRGSAARAAVPIANMIAGIEGGPRHKKHGFLAKNGRSRVRVKIMFTPPLSEKFLAGVDTSGAFTYSLSD